jgi:hypothetical protein
LVAFWLLASRLVADGYLNMAGIEVELDLVDVWSRSFPFHRAGLGRVGEGGTPVTRVPGARPMGDGASGESEVSLDLERPGEHEGAAGAPLENF